MNKEVVFDLLFAQPIGDSKFHGGGEYIKTVFQALAEDYRGEYVLTVCYDKDRFIDEWILDLIKKKKIESYDAKTATDIVVCVREKSNKAQVRFFAGMIYPYDTFHFPENVTCIGTCHGLRMLEKPYDQYAPLYLQSRADIKEMIKNIFFKKCSWHRAWNVYYNAMKRFDVLVTDSEHSAYSIRVNYPEYAKGKQIYVFYAPDKYIEMLGFEKTEKQDPYILMISANRWLKNSYRGVMALDGLYRKGYLKGIKTKVLGNLPGRIKKKIKCKECFEFLGYVSTEELEMAYHDCDIFFYPTLNEGFGLPPMEAMKYGKTCLISNVCSLPEIYGESVYYCNPYDIMEMQGRILMTLENKIAEERCFERLHMIRERQQRDLGRLCELIVGI